MGTYNLRAAALPTQNDGKTNTQFNFQFETGPSKTVGLFLGRSAQANVLIKVHATSEVMPDIRQLISEGINVNVTLLFGLPQWD